MLSKVAFTTKDAIMTLCQVAVHWFFPDARLVVVVVIVLPVMIVLLVVVRPRRLVVVRPRRLVVVRPRRLVPLGGGSMLAAKLLGLVLRRRFRWTGRRLHVLRHFDRHSMR
jgi:hypothetical protein